MDIYESFLQNYALTLYNRQNTAMFPEQRNLLSVNDYYNLLKPAMDIIKENQDKDLKEIRGELFNASGIKEAIQETVYELGLTPGIVLSYGTPHYLETIVAGNQREVVFDGSNLVSSPIPMSENTIFDLASVTKRFTSIAVLKLVQEGLINLSDKVTKYLPQCVNLSEVTIYDLLAFKVPLCTDKRVDAASSKEEAEDILFNMKINENFKPNANPYSDMGAMLLKYVIEKASGMSYYDFLNEAILKPLGMNDTFARVPDEKLKNVASTSIDSKVLENGNIITSYKEDLVLPYDDKARIMGAGNLSGHAGLFTTSGDMISLAKGLLNEEVLTGALVGELSTNRTGYLYLDENGNQRTTNYLGYLGYSKNPIESSSEVAHILSGKASASAGWLGNLFVIDPLNEIQLFLGSNRSHNRVTYINPKAREITDSFGNKIVKTDGNRSYVVLPNGQEQTDATRFAWQKGNMTDPALLLSLQYRMLEEFYGLEKEEEVVNTVTI